MGPRPTTPDDFRRLGELLAQVEAAHAEVVAAEAVLDEKRAARSRIATEAYVAGATYDAIAHGQITREAARKWVAI